MDTKFTHVEVEESREVETILSQTRLFELAHQQLLQQGLRIADDTDEAQRSDFFIKLAALCYNFGVEEGVLVFSIRNWYAGCFDEACLIVRNYYSSQEKPLGERTKMKRGQLKQLLMDDFLARNFNLRYNVMTRQTEYAPLDRRGFSFRPLSDRIRFEIRTRMEREGIDLTDTELKQRLSSTEIRDFFPMEDFLHRLPKWDKKPRIKKLAETIPTTNAEWPERFYRWFLSMVAHWLFEDSHYGNSIIPILVGRQGCGKSQWVRSLLPYELLEYYHDGFDLSRKEENQNLMTRYALINIDEFDSITARQEPLLKHLVQLTEVHVDGQPERRFCSFIGTSNHMEVFRDTSGSRRYIYVDIVGDINLNHRLSLPQIYAEAVYAIMHDKERTYFTKEEELAMQEDNEGFREQDISEQLFLHYYEPLPCREEVEGGVWLSAIEICQSLEKMSKKDLGIRRSTSFGRIVRRYCTKAGSKRGATSTLYHVRLK